MLFSSNSTTLSYIFEPVWGLSRPSCVCAVTTPSLGAQRSSHIRRIHQALRALCAPTSSPSLRTLHGASASRSRCSHSSRQPHLPLPSSVLPSSVLSPLRRHDFCKRRERAAKGGAGAAGAGRTHTGSGSRRVSLSKCGLLSSLIFSSLGSSPACVNARFANLWLQL